MRKIISIISISCLLVILLLTLNAFAQNVLSNENSLEIKLIKPMKKSYLNTEPIPVEVRVLDVNQPTENAKVMVFWRQSYVTELNEIGNGYYKGRIYSPQPSLEKNSFEVIANYLNQTIKIGRINFEVNFKKPVFEVIPLTSIKHYAFGEPFELKFGIDYPLKEGQVIYGSITVNNEFTKLFNTSKKTFTVHFTAQETFLMGKTPLFEVKLDDGHGNKITKSFKLKQTGFEIWYIKQNIIPILIILVFLFYIAYSEIKRGTKQEKKKK